MPDPGPAALELDQYIAAPPERVWRALTDPERLARWWVPGDIAAEVGHEFRLAVPGRGPVPCRVLAVDEPALLVHTFAHWTLTWRLVPEGHGTRLLLEQTGFDLDDKRDRHAYDRMGPGWRDRILPTLARDEELVPGGATGWELAQVNVASPVVPLSEPELAWFVDALEPVNAAAELASGFRWHLQTEDGDATAIRAFGDDRLIVNLTVWASLEALADFVYRDAAHVAVLRRRRESFERLGTSHQVLWWVPAGHRPAVTEAEERLDRLRAHGPTPAAFTFREPFPAPGATEAVAPDADWYCRA